MKIKEAASRLKLTEKAIRYYESQGLITPESRELNGRRFREYSEENIRMLEAVATLRKARFSVESIARMQEAPSAIPQVLADYGTEIEEAYAALGRIRELLRQPGLEQCGDLYELAAKLDSAVRDVPLPKQDVKFNFRLYDRLQAERVAAVKSLPQQTRRLGWMTIYSGTDQEQWLDMQYKLTEADIPCQAHNYTSANRMAAQGTMNMQSVEYARTGRSGQELIQVRTLNRESLNRYSVEIRRRDEARARAALRLPES